MAGAPAPGDDGAPAGRPQAGGRDGRARARRRRRFVSALTWDEDRRLGLTEVAAAAAAAGVEFVSFLIADPGVPRAQDIAGDTDVVALGVRRRRRGGSAGR